MHLPLLQFLPASPSVLPLGLLKEVSDRQCPAGSFGFRVAVSRSAVDTELFRNTKAISRHIQGVQRLTWFHPLLAIVQSHILLKPRLDYQSIDWCPFLPVYVKII